MDLNPELGKILVFIIYVVLWLILCYSVTVKGEMP